MPEEIRGLDTLTGRDPEPDYCYACQITASVSDGRSAEQWARAVLEGAPRPMRWFILTGWIVGLRLRLGPRRSPAHVLGWRILSSTPSVIVLGVESFLLSTRLVVRVEQASVVHATLVRYERPSGRLLWAATAPLHQLIIPYLLRHAATHPSQPVSSGDGK